jgi:hypothetical protein
LLTNLASYVTALSVLPLEVVLFLRVPVEDLIRSALSDESLLPEAISEALGISLAEVLDLYFREGSDKDVRDCLIWEAIDRHRMGEEDERNRLREMDAELPYQRDDTF